MNKKDKTYLKQTLDPLVYHVTQENGTERPFSSIYDQFNEVGIYVDVISKEALFSSLDKYDAGCGWPSFVKPITPLKEVNDYSFNMHRIEVRSLEGDSHLGQRPKDGGFCCKPSGTAEARTAREEGSAVPKRSRISPQQQTRDIRVSAPSRSSASLDRHKHRRWHARQSIRPTHNHCLSGFGRGEHCPG